MDNQAWRITAPNKIELQDLGPMPTPGPNQVLVRIHAVSLNYRDILVVGHSPSYPILASPSLIPCSDGAGIIHSVGPDSSWNVGDRVIIHPNSWLKGDDARDFDITGTMGAGTIDGTLRKYIVWDDEKLVRAPEGLSLEEASTMYTAGATAWRALMHSRMRLEPGMKVLTQGTGGVSCYAIQIAAAYGATVVAISSSDEKLKAATRLGATHVVNYRKSAKWSEEVLKVTANTGVDIVVDVVGAGSIEETLRGTRHGGHISLVGNLSEDPDQKVNIMPSLLYGAKTVQGLLGAGSVELSRELAAFMEKHNIHPAVAHTFEFEEAQKALETAAKLKNPGKVVIRV